MAAKTEDLLKPNDIAGAIQTMTPSSLALQSNPGNVPETSSFLPAPSPSPTPAPTPTATPAPEDNRTVEQRLNGLLAGDSDYIKMARAAGLKTANARGLLNSSMAAGAAQGAAIERALPIAQADTDIAAQDRRLRVSTQAESDRLREAAGYDMERLRAQGGIDLARDAAQAKSAQDLARVQGTIQSALQAQGNTEQMQRMGVELSNQLTINAQQLTSDLTKIAAAGDEDIRRLVEAANQERVTLQQSIAAQDRQAMATAMVNIFQIEAQMRSALLGNDKISASERAAYEKTISGMGDPLRNYVNQLFSPPPTPATGLDPTGALGGTDGFGSGLGGSAYAETGGINPETASTQALVSLAQQGGLGGSTAQRILDERGVKWV